MVDVPKIVHDRLRLASREQSESRLGHPDADLLTAFAEQALAVAERDGILAHLALCTDCREVVALALPEAAVEAVPVSVEIENVGTSISRAGKPAPPKLRFAWPSLRWAALAAGVAVVAGVFLTHPANQKPSMIAQMVAPQTVPAATVTTVPVVESKVSAKADSPKLDAARTRSDSVVPNGVNAKAAAPSEQAENSQLLASNKKGRAVAGKVATAPLPEDKAFLVGGRASQSTSENVESSPKSGSGDVSGPSGAGAQMARNIPASNPAEAGDSPAIERAKPATPQQETQPIEKQSGAALSEETPLDGRNGTAPQIVGPSANRHAAAMSPKITWEIAGGVLQRSADNGQTWQNVALHSDHPLLCFAAQGTQIWTGGAAGSLFHSVDRGVTWTQVHPLIDMQELDSDITHIDIQSGNGSAASSLQIVISTSKESTNNRETWSSADGGATWVKK